MKRDAVGRARYEEIAQDIAQRIADGDLAEGSRVLGRSALAGQYQVSPETIRRAVAILAERSIVQSVAGSGIRVLSRYAAVEYLDSQHTRTTLEEGARELRALLRQRDEINARIEAALDRVMSQATGALSTRNVEEVVIKKGAWVAGRSLVDIRLRTCTGATVAALTRGEVDYFSPPVDMELKPGDVVTLVGAEAQRARAREILTATEPPAEE
ncbi:MAG: GntR family transcriptional regulator [Symbiobacteriaceae bacterium]|nr:GntR family transcriptional regulator [Symbiobacteriaceae bacterium]